MNWERVERYKELADQITSIHDVKEDSELYRLAGELLEEEFLYIERYYACIQDGCTPKLADMLALQKPPAGVSDCTFLAGHCNGSQFDKGPFQRLMGDKLRAEAEANGQNTKGKVYLGSLAKYPGDPAAWVESRDDVKRVCERRGWGCEGSGITIEPKNKGRRPGKKAGSLAKRLYDAGLPMSGD
jgi:hypothetical protein